MKKILLTSILLISTLFAKSQALDYLDLPVIGELWIEFKDTTATNIVITGSGAGQTWNYLNSFNVHDTIEFLPQATSSAPTAIASLYPQSN
ncbi:hypothetical protein, partial [Klebsiella pneumoniae]|uniref:hypothetical protein n=1 Tax=Klebsiella pneumoniae TaxID=573 RepID=UPI0037BED483